MASVALLLVHVFLALSTNVVSGGIRGSSAPVLDASSADVVSGWQCTSSQPKLGTRHLHAGSALHGLHMLADRESVPDKIPYADLSRFPKTFACRQKEGISTSFADVLKTMLDPCFSDHNAQSCHAHNIFRSSGAILVRGLPFSNVSGLAGFLRGINASLMSYAGGIAPSDFGSNGAMQASIEPAELAIEPHWLMSYAASFPHLLFFYCHRRPAANEVGLTPITDGRAVLQTLRELNISQSFEQHGVLHRFYYPSKYDNSFNNSSMFSTFNWETVFRTESKGEVDKLLAGRKSDYPSLRWNWLDGWPGGPQVLEYTFWKEAVVWHPHSPREQVWFNQIASMHRSYFHSHPTFPELLDVPVPYVGDSAEPYERRYPFDTAYGDGSEISEDTIRKLRQAYWNHSVVFQWEEGDLLMLDNMVAAHGRTNNDDLKDSGRELFISLLRVASDGGIV